MSDFDSTKKHSYMLIYHPGNGKTNITVRLEDDTVWLSQKQLSELFQAKVNIVNYHIKEIFDTKELYPESVIRKFRITRQEGGRTVERNMDFYNLDMVISVGYRIKPFISTRFYQWSVKQLRVFIIKEFLLDDDRLKNSGESFDYFEDVLSRIQDIRASEKRFYHKITDIYATSVDYDPTQEISIDFFRTVQNKIHWAITGKTASEIVYSRANSSKPNMGLTSWHGEAVRKRDITVAKNYLLKKEIESLNMLMEQYLLFAEGQAMRRIPMHMKDWIKKLDAFLSLNDREVLCNEGDISRERATRHAGMEYGKYKVLSVT